MAELYALEYNSHGRVSLLNFEKTGDKKSVAQIRNLT